MEVFMTKFFGAATAAVAAIVWLVRLEAVALSNRREIKRLWEQRREDLDAAKAARDNMDMMLREMRDDIKTLLRGGK